MNERALKQFFKQLNRCMLIMWRLGMGRLINIWPQVIGRIMVITHTGRKSGLRRHTPVNYAVVGGEVYCAAGFGASSDWYRNMLASPEVEIWLPEGWWAGKAQLADNHTDRLDILRQILINSGFAAGLFAGIHPRKMNDSTLDQLTRDYPLVCIQRVSPCTGSGGPADLVWVWPALAHIALLGWLMQKIFGKYAKSRRNE
jgi:deazaflavin-dependent oxidoreductase (nitroreductase family)